MADVTYIPPPRIKPDDALSSAIEWLETYCDVLIQEAEVFIDPSRRRHVVAEFLAHKAAMLAQIENFRSLQVYFPRPVATDCA